MNSIIMIVMGIAVAFNLIIIKWKIEHERYSDALLDGIVLVLLGIIFAGTISGLMVGTVASAIVSLYLMIVPPKEFFKLNTNGTSNIKEIIKPKRTRKIR